MIEYNTLRIPFYLTWLDQHRLKQYYIEESNYATCGFATPNYCTITMQNVVQPACYICMRYVNFEDIAF